MTNDQQLAINIPGYIITTLAGKGGMGTVYKAKQSSPRRTVAIKVLSGAAPDAASLAAFRREADLIAHLEHPHILPLYDFGEHEGMPYLVLRYLGGGSIADRIRKGPIDVATASRWMHSVADALEFAHQKGLIHKDIKPSNVLLDDADNAYLTDFGIAGALTTAGSGTPLGSAAYMSPEQGKGESIDARIDIYALSVMLFEMLTGHKPYTAETALGLIVRHINDPIPSARNLNPAIPQAVDELIQWGMAKDPAERPQSAAEFARLLQQAHAHPSAPLRANAAQTTIARARTTVVARPQRQMNWALWIGMIAVVGLCLVGIAVIGGGTLAALVFSSTATPIPTATKLSPTPAVPTPEGRLLADDFSDPHSGFAVASDKDGSVAYANDALQFKVLTKGVEWFSPSGRAAAEDVTIDVDVQHVSGPAKNEMSVLCRWRDFTTYTAFAISGDGTFSIWQKVNGEVKRLIDWTPGASLTAGPQHLHVTCAGTTLRFEANGVLLAETNDAQPTVGDVALMAGLREAGELNVTFDNLIVTK